MALLPEEAEAVGLRTDSTVVEADPDDPARGLRAGRRPRRRRHDPARRRACRGAPARPLLGVNLGHVGFLAEAEREDSTATVERIVSRDYTVEERMTLDVTRRQATARWWRGPGR